MTFGDLLKMTADERRKLVKLAKCAGCGIELQESITGCRETSEGHVCSDCYYEKLGELVEKHPIGIPRMHRGA